MSGSQKSTTFSVGRCGSCSSGPRLLSCWKPLLRIDGRSCMSIKGALISQTYLKASVLKVPGFSNQLGRPSLQTQHGSLPSRHRRVTWIVCCVKHAWSCNRINLRLQSLRLASQGPATEPSSAWRFFEMILSMCKTPIGKPPQPWLAFENSGARLGS